MIVPRFLVAVAYWIASFLAAIIIGLALSGCAAVMESVRYEAPKGYWVKSPRAPRTDFVVFDVDDTTPFCAHPNSTHAEIFSVVRNGCIQFGYAPMRVYLSKQLTPEVRLCLLGHEATGKRSHAAGYDHPAHPYSDLIDCGDGTMIALQPFAGQSSRFSP